KASPGQFKAYGVFKRITSSGQATETVRDQTLPQFYFLPAQQAHVLQSKTKKNHKKIKHKLEKSRCRKTSGESLEKRSKAVRKARKPKLLHFSVVLPIGKATVDQPQIPSTDI